MLSVNNLSAQILKNISFTLESGKNLTILGANGSGKTTLAKAICHLIRNDCVTLEGKKIGDYTPAERAKRINFIPAKLHIYDEYLSVSDYLKLNLIDPSRSGYLNSVLALLEMEYLRESGCHRLSSGESALLLIGGAMIHHARYTILDEPTANLDQAKKVKVFHLLKNSSYFQNKIIITHDLNLASKLDYPVLYLEKGEVRFFGECDRFFDPDHLKRCFGDYVKNIDGNFVVNYDEAL